MYIRTYICTVHVDLDTLYILYIVLYCILCIVCMYIIMYVRMYSELFMDVFGTENLQIVFFFFLRMLCAILNN